MQQEPGSREKRQRELNKESVSKNRPPFVMRPKPVTSPDKRRVRSKNKTKPNGTRAARSHVVGTTCDTSAVTLVGPYGGQDHGPGKRKRRGEHGSYQFAQGVQPLSTSRVRWDSGNRSGSPVKPLRFSPPSYTMFPFPATVLCLQRDRRPFRTGGSLENERS